MSQQLVRKVRTILVMVVIVGTGVVMWMQQQTMKRAAEMAREHPLRGPAKPAGGETARAKSLRDLQYRDPESALKLAEEILAQPASAAEQQVGRELHPVVLEACFGWRLKNQREADALTLRARLAELYPEARQNQAVSRQWVDRLVRQAGESWRINDGAAAEAALKTLFAEPSVEQGHRNVFEQWQRRKLDAWSEARKGRGPGTDALLIDAAAILVAADAHGQFVRTVAQADLPGQAVALLGDTAARGETRHAALAFWQAALTKLDMNQGSWTGDRRAAVPAQLEAIKQELRRKLMAGWQELAARRQSGERPAYVLVDATAALTAAADVVRGRPEEVVVLVKLLEQEMAEMHRLGASVTDLPFERLGREDGLKYEDESRLTTDAYTLRGRLANVCQRTGERLWRACLARPTFNPWPSIPPAVLAALAEADKTGKWPEAEKRRFLERHYAQDATAIPLAELMPAADLLHAVNARWGLVELRSSAESGFDKLREVLREARNEDLRAEVAGALRRRLAASREKKDFEKYYLLAGFYATEAGLPAAGDPFRDEFRDGLVTAAETFKGREPMKEIFMLSLLAEVFATEVAGQQARDRAFDLAFETVAGMPVETEPARLEPSGLPGHSLHRIDNSTQYHLLCFYRGPERFMVHSRPYRRGTAALANGDYEVVVLCPDGSIRPYRGRIAMQSAVRTSDYHVESKGGATNRPNVYGSPAGGAGGDYRLLRAPANAPEVAIDPRTGLLRTGRR